MSMDQIKLHKKIDNLIQAGIAMASVVDVRDLVNVNDDARRYFLSRAGETWLDWLWTNGFLGVIRQKTEDPTQYSYRTPELDYLARVVEKKPARVVDFMLDVLVSAVTFNPEVIDRFLWISSKLPADQLARIVPKIRDEQWVPLMGPFNRWGVEYKAMFDTLAAAKDHKSIVTLAEVILTVRTKDDTKRNPPGSADSPFYFNDLHRSEVFERLSEIDESNIEAALALALMTLGEIVILNGKKEDDVFQYGGMFELYDVDFFTLDSERGRHPSHRDDVRDLAAVAKLLVRKTVGGLCDRPGEVRRIYDSYVVPLPGARTMWRFRLFVWCLCPEIFAKELKEAFQLIFKHKTNPWPIVGGAEYEQALKVAFHVFSEDEQRKYVQGVFGLVGGEKRPNFLYGIFASIAKYLTDEEKVRAEKVIGRPLQTSYEPAPTIGRSYAGLVVPQAPSDADNEWKKSIPEIVALLKTTWTPQALLGAAKEQNPLRPINAEGVAGRLQGSIKVRLQDYVSCARLFFERGGLDSHYTNSFLRGIQEAIKADHTKAASIDWGPLVSLGMAIVESGVAKPFDHKAREREQFDTWLVGWTGVHMSLADVIQELLRPNGGRVIVDFNTYREKLFTIISYLLKFPDPQPEDERIETAKIKEKPSGEDYQVSDPFTIAINSVRGRTFQTFLQFVQQGSKRFPKEAGSKLSQDVRDVYGALLARENTGAIMFLYGHYLAFFYYRDSAWIRALLPKIFPGDPNNIDLYLAAWEGYLTASVYKEIFDGLQGEYERAMALDPSQYTRRQYHGDLDEALATHLALAYIHFEDFTLQSRLFKLFWNTPNTKRHGAFISFIGRHVISRDRPEEWLKENPKVSIEKLQAFWDWALANCSDKVALQKFGSWMQAKFKKFNPVWLVDRINKTLEKTGGDIDWEFGFIESLPALAAAAPDKTHRALRRHLIDGSILKEARGYIRVDSSLLEVFRILYNNSSTRDGTYTLINDLLPIGNGQFWGLKEIVSSNS